MLKFDSPAPVSAVIDIVAGRIWCIATDRADTSVVIEPVDSADSRDVQAAEQIEVAYDDGVLRIAAPTPSGTRNRVLGNSGSVEVIVQLPAGSRVEAKSAGAELRGVGRLGDITFDSAQATVKLDETASVRIGLLAGDITVARLVGSADISTQMGDIHITEAVRGTVTLRTELGDIAVGAARDTSATLDAGTTHGRITNTLNNSGGPAADLRVHATTAHGDITAHCL